MVEDEISSCDREEKEEKVLAVSGRGRKRKRKGGRARERARLARRRAAEVNGVVSEPLDKEKVLAPGRVVNVPTVAKGRPLVQVYVEEAKKFVSASPDGGS